MVVSHHYLIGMTVPVLSFPIVTCKLLDCVPAMGKSNERGVSGFLSELRPCRTTFSRQLIKKKHRGKRSFTIGRIVFSHDENRVLTTVNSPVDNSRSNR